MGDRPAIDDTLRTERGSSSARRSRGQRLGRYLVLSEIGAGAMGVVYRAYDPDLNRKVALKVLRNTVADPDRELVARVRLQREAQTLARLMHPNVVAVFDVGMHDTDVFVAMELLEGDNLATWLADESHTVDEVLAALREAGRGLAAAHEVGIVHRDFKPSNVLVGQDGRVSVTDFGLARPDATQDPAGPAEDRTADSGESMGDGSLFDLSLTEQGRAVGTPAYMAPEQHLGESVDPRADQFAFCVTLFEALYRRRPFDATGPRLVAEQKMLGLARRPAAKGPRGRVPARVRRALWRGLSPDPARRFPRLADLLAQLSTSSRRLRSRTWVAAGLGASAALVVGLAVGDLRSDVASPCDDAGPGLAGVWDDEVRERMEAAFLRVERPYAAHAFEVVAAQLDARADGWRAQRRDACEATWERHEQSQAAFDRRMTCLVEQRRELAATADVLAHADAPVIDRAAAMAIALSDPRACANPPASPDATVATPPDEAEAIEAARGRLAEAQAARRAGRHGQALRIAREVARGLRVTHIPTRLAVQIFEARMLDDDGDAPAAADRRRAAAVAARGAGLARAEAEAFTELTRIVGGRLHDPQQGALYGELALAAVASAGGDDDLAAAAHLELGEVAFRQGDDASARRHITEALRRREARYGTGHYLVAETLGRLAGVQFREGDTEAAAASLHRALDAYRRVLGPSHPRLAGPIGNLGLVLAADGRIDEALDAMTRAKAIMHRAYGSDHPGVAMADDSIGQTLATARRYDEAEAAFRAALDGYARSIGPDDPRVAAPLLGLGETLLSLERPGEAVEPLERARAIAAARALPPTERAAIEFGLARALGQGARAVALARSARATWAEIEPDNLAIIDDWLASR